MNIHHSSFIIHHLILLLPLVALTGCAELGVLRERVDFQEKTIKRLRQENSEFQAAYYKIKETLDSENSRSQKSVTQLQHELDQARNLKSKQEKDLEDQLRARNLEYDALKSEAADQKAQADKLAVQLQRDLQAAGAERDAALNRIKDLDARLVAEQTHTANLIKQEAALKVDLQTAADRQAALQKDLAERDKSLEVEKQSRQGAETRLAELDKQLAAQSQSLQQVQAKAAQLTRQLDEAAAAAGRKIQLAQSEKEKLAGEKEKLAAQVESLTAKQARPNPPAQPQPGQAAATAEVPARDPELAAAAAQLKAKLKTLSKARDVQVRVDRRSLRVILPCNLLFDGNTTILADRSTTVLMAVAQALKLLPGRPVSVEGHTDNQAVQDMPFADNWGLGFARADRVRDYLMKDGGVSGSRLTALSRAQFEPLTSNDTAEGRAQNRRVEIVVGGKSESR